MAERQLASNNLAYLDAPSAPDTLPPGWTCALLGGLGRWISGGTPSKNRADFWTNGRIPWVSPKDMKRDRLKAAIDSITSAAVEHSNLKLIPVRGVLFVVRGMILAHTFPVALAETELTINQDMRAIIPSDAIDAEFLLYFLKSDSFRVLSVVKEATHGTLRLDSDMLRNWPIPLPPLSEQKRIVEKVEKVLARINAARDRLAKVPPILKRFRQSVLAAACSGQLTSDWRADHPQIESVDTTFERLRDHRCAEYESAIDAARSRRERAPRKPAYLEDVEEDGVELPSITQLPESWKLLRVQDAAVHLQYGTSVKADAPADTGVPMLRMGNVQDGQIDMSDLKYMDPNSDDLNSFLLHQGDIVFNRTNSPELVGKAGVFNADGKIVFASYLVRLKCDPRLVQSGFVCNWINSLWGKAWARAVRTDGVSQSNINATKLAAMPLPVPPLPEQEVIGRRVCELFDLAEKIEKRVALGTLRAEKLVQATLAKAFRGEFVPTEAELAEQEGCEYETAEALLKRLKSGSESQTSRAKRTKVARIPDNLFSVITEGHADAKIAKALTDLSKQWKPLPQTTPSENLLVKAFKAIAAQNSPDRVVADPQLHQAFIKQCRTLGLEDSEFDLCFSLLNLRKSNELKNLHSARNPVRDRWKYAAASEIAARVVYYRHGLTVDRIICHPTFVKEFEEIARGITPGFSSFEYRWAALGLRKVGKKAAQTVVERLKWSDPVSFTAASSLPNVEGVYALHDQSDCLFVYGTESIRESIAAQTNFGTQDFFGKGLWRPDPKRLVWKYAKAAGGTSNRQGIVNALVSQWTPVLNVPRVA